jgi:phosphatidylglycerophosphate synthase
MIPGAPEPATTMRKMADIRSQTGFFQNATRIQDSLTARLEKGALHWLATHMPASISSDHLTLLGFTSMFLAGASYALSRSNPIGLPLATLFLAINWLGDSLDGTLARVRNRQRPRYGFYVDHIIDSFGAIFLMSGLAISGFVQWKIAMAMLIAFLLLSIETYLATYTLGLFKLSFAKFGPTELRILLALGNAVLWFRPNAAVPGLGVRIFDFGGIIAAVGMSGMAVFAAVRHTSQLYNEERLP